LRKRGRPKSKRMKDRKVFLTDEEKKEVKELIRYYDRLKRMVLRSRGIRYSTILKGNPEESRYWQDFVLTYQKAKQNCINPFEWVATQFLWYAHFLRGTPKPVNLYDSYSMKRWSFAVRYLDARPPS